MPGNPALPTDTNVYSAYAGFNVTPSDVTVFSNSMRGLYVGTGGNVAVRMIRDGNSLIYKNVPSGTLLPIAVDQVQATGTTAADMICLR
jgi:hypothetical protein